MENSQYQQSKSWTLFTRVAAIVGLFASIAAVIGVAIEIKSERREVEIQMVSMDQLTSLPNVVGLNGEFSYKGVNVIDLWKFQVRFVNSGDVILIGEGQPSILLQGSIPIEFPKGTTVLDIGKSQGDFLSLEQISSNLIQLTFSQWRPGEEFETTIYLTSDTVLEKAPLPSVLGRPIIEGDVIVKNLTIQTIDGEKPALDFLPRSVATIGRIVSIIVVVIITGFMLYLLLIEGPTEYRKARKWANAHQSEIIEILNDLDLLPAESVKFLKSPWLLGQSWNLKNKDGKEISYAERDKIRELDAPSVVAYNTPWQVFQGITIGILIFLICAAIIAGLVII